MMTTTPHNVLGKSMVSASFTVQCALNQEFLSINTIVDNRTTMILLIIVDYDN